MRKGEPLTDDEQHLFFSLLRRLCENHVDQWLMMRMQTDPLDWYIHIGLIPPHGIEYAKEYFPVNEGTRLTNHAVSAPDDELE